MSEAQDDFFANAPQDYEVPKSDSKYMKFKEPGDYKLRMLQRPIFGWEGWVKEEGKNKPYRFKWNEKPKDTSRFERGEVSHFWAMPVWNFATKRVEVLSFTTKSIQSALESYARNEDWKSPLGYNVTINRVGTGRDDTKYSTIASPHSDLTEEIVTAWAEVEKEGFDINELFFDGDPFKPETREKTEDVAS